MKRSLHRLAAWRRTAASGGIVGLPSVLIVAGALGLWALWPAAPARRARAEGTALPRTVYGRVEQSLFMSPDLFARATAAGFRPEDPAEGDLDRVAPPRPVRSYALSVAPPRTVDVPPAPAVMPGTAVERRYRPVWAVGGTGGAGGGEPVLLVEARGALAARGFEVPSLTNGFDVAGAPPNWQVEAFVSVDTGGVVRVLVESSSGLPALDRDVVRLLTRGTVGDPAQGECTGRVLVSYGRQP